MMEGAHLRMIKDKVREEDQIKVACFRIGSRGIRVWFGLGIRLGLGILQQRASERINGSSPHVPQNAHGTAGGSLSLSAPSRSLRLVDDVLVYVVD